MNLLIGQWKGSDICNFALPCAETGAASDPACLKAADRCARDPTEQAQGTGHESQSGSLPEAQHIGALDLIRLPLCAVIQGLCTELTRERAQLQEQLQAMHRQHGVLEVELTSMQVSRCLLCTCFVLMRVMAVSQWDIISICLPRSDPLEHGSMSHLTIPSYCRRACGVCWT